MKRAFLMTVLLAIAASAFAFDPALWLGKRQIMMREAERLAAAYTNCVARLEQPAEGVAVPIETFPDGAVKLLVSAKRAQFFLDTGMVWAEGVIIRKFEQDGVEKSRIEAAACVIDRNSKSGWASGRAKVVHGTTEFTGEDVYFSSPEGYIISTKKSLIVTKDMKFGGAL